MKQGTDLKKQACRRFGRVVGDWVRSRGAGVGTDDGAAAQVRADLILGKVTRLSKRISDSRHWESKLLSGCHHPPAPQGTTSRAVRQ